ncbi:MAG: nucleoid-associated protein YgaU [Bacteriovoracaceae bacterium]|jgi:nucleoid-associated protein YgaU
MKLLKVLFFISIFALVSCSNNKKKAAANKAEDAALEMEDESDFIVDSDEEDLELSVDSEASEMMATDETIIMDGADNATSISMTDAVGDYTVQKGDTMMLIAFKIYGDYRKWKTLKDMNPSMDRLVEGASLKYSEPSEKFVWNPAGLPHLIQNGETLGTISNDKYGTATKWKLLYENNRPMIHDPNLIFAGFTLYYVPERDVASE